MSDSPRIYKINFASVYPLYVAKAEKKSRTKAEVDEIICWLTGYSQTELEKIIRGEISLEAFYVNAPRLNPSRTLITGVISAYASKKSKNQPCARSATSTN